MKSKVTKLIPVCQCPKCDTPIQVSLKKIGQLIRAERKTEPTNEFMKMISRKGVLARKKNAKIKNQIPQQRP
jgi:hypothetical protein